jgi:hypothetical protein
MLTKLPGYYVVTPALYLHHFKENDYVRKDPQPELSIYLPDAVIGSTNGEKFHVKGKDVSKGLSSKLSGSSELNFKAHTPADAEKWVEILKMAQSAGHPGTNPATPISPLSPAVEKQASFGPAAGAAPVQQEQAHAHPAQVQTQGITGGETVASPTYAAPASAEPKFAPNTKDLL